MSNLKIRIFLRSTLCNHFVLVTYTTIHAFGITLLTISLPAVDRLPTDSTADTDKAAASINEAFTSPSILSQDQHSSDPLFGSLNSKITTSPESADETPSDDPMDTFFSPEVQISGKIPSGDNMDGGIAAPGAFRGQVSKPSGKEN